MDIPRGGHAFPQNDAAVNRINNEAGMSLRDYFAAKAMASLLHPDVSWEDSKLAKAAYDVADAMIKQRRLPQ